MPNASSKLMFGFSTATATGRRSATQNMAANGKSLTCFSCSKNKLQSKKTETMTENTIETVPRSTVTPKPVGTEAHNSSTGEHIDGRVITRQSDNGPMTYHNTVVGGSGDLAGTEKDLKKDSNIESEDL